MPRAKRGVIARARHKKVLNAAKGYRGRRKNVYRIAKQAVMKAGQYAYRDRRQKKRQFRTLWIALDEMDQMWLPVERCWQFNERHYGALQGLNKAETAARHGDEQVLKWRRGYAIQPPPLDPQDPMNPKFDQKPGRNVNGC